MKNLKIAGIFLIILRSGSPLFAENYYINNHIGNDSSRGTREQPWKGFRNLELKTFRPGDSIFFACGSSYTGGFTFTHSGTKDRPIVFTSYSAGQTETSVHDRSELGEVFIHYGAGPLPAFTNPDWKMLNGNIFRIEASHIVIDGLYFHDNTNPPSSDHRNKNVQKMGAVYLATGTHDNIVRNCEFFRSPVGIKVKGDHNLITHNYLHDATEPMARSWGPIAIMIVSAHNEVCWNRIVNYGSYGGPYGSDGGVIELDGVDDDFHGRDIDIHHNISINNHGFLELAARNVDSITVAYNFSDDTNQFIGGGGMKNVFVYNNTVIRTREPNIDRHVFWTFYPASTSFTVKNNIFVLARDIQVFGPMTDTSGHKRTGIGDHPHAHNLYFASGSKDPIGITAGKGDRIANPLFVDAANGNYRLTKNSPAVNNAGRTGYTVDLDGYSIPKGGKPDIGAYEF